MLLNNHLDVNIIQVTKNECHGVADFFQNNTNKICSSLDSVSASLPVSVS